MRFLARVPASTLSHEIGTFLIAARFFHKALCNALSAKVFLDSDNLHDLRELLQEVKQSDFLILFQTKKVLTRPW